MTTKVNLMARIGQAQAAQSAYATTLRVAGVPGNDPQRVRAEAYSCAFQAVIAASEGNTEALARLTPQ